MEEGLKIKVGADVIDVVKSMDKVVDSAEDAGKALDKLADKKIDLNASELSNTLDKVDKNIKKVNESVAALGKGKGGFDDFTQKLGAIKKPAGDATNALTNFGRIAQDAPFGLIGITNNINPALESFQRLSQQTGSTGAALKSLVAGLAGPAGIGVAVSVVTSVVTSLVMKYGSLSSAVAVLTSNLGNLGKAQRDLNNSLATSGTSIEGERATMNALFAIARDTTLTTEARREAINKLNQDYGQYLGNLTQETINTDAVNAAQQRLNQTLINQARIKGVQDLISKETAKQAELFIQMSDQLKEKSGFGKFLDMIAELNPALQGTGVSLKQVQVKKFVDDMDEAEERVQLFNKALEKLLTDEAISGNLFTKIPKPAKEAGKKITKYIHEGLTPIDIPIEWEKNAKIQVKKVRHLLNEVEKSSSFGGEKMFEITGYDENGRAIHQASVEAWRNFNKYWKEQEKKKPLYLEAPKIKMDAIKGDYEKFFSGQQKIMIEAMKNLNPELLKRFNFKVTGDITTDLKNLSKIKVAVEGITTAAAALGEIFADVFRTIATEGKISMKQIGNSIKMLIVDLIAAAIRAAILALIFKAIGLEVGGASSFSGIFAKLMSGGGGTGMATGGIVPPGYPNDTFPARLSSNEAVIPLDRLDSIMGGRGDGGILTARVSGNDLLFIMDRAGRSQRRSF